jgi:hypothetical protein
MKTIKKIFLLQSLEVEKKNSGNFVITLKTRSFPKPKPLGSSNYYSDKKINQPNYCKLPKIWDHMQ